MCLCFPIGYLVYFAYPPIPFRLLRLFLSTSYPGLGRYWVGTGKGASETGGRGPLRIRVILLHVGCQSVYP